MRDLRLCGFSDSAASSSISVCTLARSMLYWNDATSISPSVYGCIMVSISFIKLCCLSCLSFGVVNLNASLENRIHDRIAVSTLQGTSVNFGLAEETPELWLTWCDKIVHTWKNCPPGSGSTGWLREAPVRRDKKNWGLGTNVLFSFCRRCLTMSAIRRQMWFHMMFLTANTVSMSAIWRQIWYHMILTANSAIDLIISIQLAKAPNKPLPIV